MKGFKGGAELRLTKEDLAQALESFVNNKLLKYEFKYHNISNLSLHPGNKYVIRLELTEEMPESN